MTRPLPLAALAAAPLALLATPASADTLIANANGLRIAADGSLDRFDALLVGDDGRIKAVLPKGAPAPRADRRIDAGGKTLLPGMIDAHGHVMGLGLAALDLDLTGTASIAELRKRLADHAAKTPGKGWIVGRGWNQELWGGAMPTSADLDAAVADRPVWLERVDGHAAVANGAALKAAGVGPGTKAPAGGAIENGLFVDAARALVEGHIPAPDAARRDAAFAAAQRILLENGITAAADMGTSVADWAVMRRAGDSGQLRLRVMSYAMGLDTLHAIAGPAPTPWLYGDRLRMGGVKLYTDGALGSRGAWLKAPYADRPETRGLPLMSAAEHRAAVETAIAGGFQVASHAIGDAANAMVIATYEDVARRGGDLRLRIEHAQVLDVADLGRLAPAGIIASMQPTHQTSDMTMAEARLGPARLGGAYAWNSLHRSGARLALGSDFPVEHPNPFPGLAAAVSRMNPKGEPAGGWRPEEKIDARTALSGFTADAAWAGFADGRFGRLVPGEWADFILVDRDPFSAAPTALAATRLLETWVAGRREYQRPADAAAAR